MTAKDTTRKPYRHDMTGERYGRLVVKSFHKKRKGKQIWMCLCDCGNEKPVVRCSLLAGYAKSCGCLNKEVASRTRTKHGCSKESWFCIYDGMVGRCSDPNHPSYHHYGGRGIHVCQSWLDNPMQFHLDMGDRPEGTSLDRIDNNAGYSPDNCRWASHEEQMQNTRRTVLNPEMVMEMRAMWDAGISVAVIRDKFVPEADEKTVRSAVTRKSWKNI